MNNNYTLKNRIIFIVSALISLSLFSTEVFSQAVIKKDFTQRTSQLAPGDYKGKQTYSLQGDFTMMGNANAFHSPYSDVENNRGNMKFTKLSGDPLTIVNSSSADLKLPAGVNMACTKIIYAGLYWTGRGDDNSGDILSRTSNAGNGLEKKKVKFKAPGMTSYIDLRATDIYYGGSDVSGMYAGYHDVTDYVKAAGLGTYAVGNVATFEGADAGGTTGYYGGWGMVVVYENTALKWRDITIFDGFAQISSTGLDSNGQLDVSGFRAAQNGDVNIKMGMMAGEGDRSISGDYFQIKKQNTTNWQSLSHGGNTTSNFFNSSIFTGNNTRTPNNLNNYGIDVAMFDLPNSGNALIANNQTSTSFKFGTTQDAYSIFNITFAVDAYVPQIEAINLPTGGLNNNGSVSPNQDLEFEIDVYNKGTEAIKNGIIEVVLPPNVNFASAEPTLGGGTASWSHPYSTDPSTTPGGKIIWNIGDISLPTDPKTIVGKLKYKVRVTNDCTLLTTSASDCGKIISITGKISGTGTVSSNNSESKFIIGYQDGACLGNPIRDPFGLTINVDNSFVTNCPERSADGAKIFKECSKAVLRTSIISSYPAGTKFYSQIPGSTNYQTSLISGDFPNDQLGNVTKYYAVVEGMASDCYLKLQTQIGGCKIITNPMIPTKFKKLN